jgi:predicted Zn-dependent peptidase
MDRIGAQVNAFTGKDMTCYYTKATTAHAEEAFEILSDLFLNCTFPEEEMVREKGVIIEEINMNEDTPDDLCLDELGRAFYGESGYGRNILGTPKNVMGFTKKDVQKYLAERYTTENIVISMAGNIDISLAENMVEKYFGGMMKKTSPKRDIKVELQGKSVLKKKDIEQIHIGIAYPSVKRYDRLYDATQIMNSVLGGSMSSRLFQSVREKLGLAYTVYSYISPYESVGSLVVYAGVNAKNYKQSVGAIYDCIEQIKKKDMTQDEFERGKEQLISSSIFAQESTSSQMLLYGKELLYHGCLYDFEKRVNDISAVTLDEVFESIEMNFHQEHKAIALIGNLDEPLPL